VSGGDHGEKARTGDLVTLVFVVFMLSVVSSSYVSWKIQFTPGDLLPDAP
jgi:hypothetical protein